MILPDSSHALDSSIRLIGRSTSDAVAFAAFIDDSSKPKLPTGYWSSVIGIVTAICGNVLISVALNTQRYAHIRLHDQWVEKHRRRKKLLRQASYRAYGAVDGNGAKENRNEVRRAPASANEDGDEEETAPLLSSSAENEHGDGESPDAGPEEIPEEVPKKSYLKSPLWWAGQIMMMVGEAGNFLAYGFAPASIVSPLGVVALVSNCIIAPFFLKEQFRPRDGFGVVVAIAGAVTVALSATNDNPKLGPDEIWSLIATWEFETYFGITLFAIICLMVASTKYGGKSIFIDLGLQGLLGGYTALSTKGVASMLSYTLFKALTFPVTYLLVAVLVLTAILQIKYLNRALSRFNATQVIPTQFVLFTLSVILGSAILYRDFERTSGEQAGKFVAGCAMTFAGVWLITSSRERESDEEEGFEEDDEAILLGADGGYQGIAGNLATPRRSSAHVNASRTSLPNGQPSSRRRTSESLVFPSLSTSLIPADSPSPIATPQAQQAPSVAPSIPSSYADGSSISEQQESGKRTLRNRISFQRLLQPFAAIFPHHTPEPQLPTNPEATNSTPVLPSEALLQHSRPETPRGLSDQDHLTTPIAPHAADGAHLLSRQSLSAFVPPPLSAPLSGSLSAIVAESLRRGVDVDSIRHRRRRPKLKMPGIPWKAGFRKRATSESDATQVPRDDGTEEDLRDLYAESPSRRPNARAEGNPERADGEGGESQGRRARSLSTTLGDLLRRKRRKIDTPQEGSDTETAAPANGVATSSA